MTINNLHLLYDPRILITPFDPVIYNLAWRLQTPEACFNFVRDNIKYVPDPNEVWRTPAKTLELGYGDCIKEGELIIVIGPKGYKMVPIEDIRAGDKVLSYDFKMRKWVSAKVTKTIFKGEKPLYKVYLKNGSSFTCTSNHKLFNRRIFKLQGRRYSTFIECPLSELKAQPVGTAGFKLPQIAVAHTIPTLNHDLPNNVSDEELWLMGYYVAEGWKEGSHRALSGYAKEVPKMLERANVSYRLAYNTGGVPEYFIHANQPLSALIDQCGSKSIDKQFPEWVLGLKLQKILPILDGYTKGDGYEPKRVLTSHKNLKVMFTTRSKQLANQLRFIFWLLGNPIWTQYQNDSGGVAHTDAWRLYAYHPWVKKGWHSQFEWKGISSTGVKKVELIGKGPCYDITVEGTHNFVLAESGVIAHNCDDQSILLCSLFRALGEPSKVLIIAFPDGGHATVEWRPGRIRDPTIKNSRFDQDVVYFNAKLIAEFNDIELNIYDQETFENIIVAEF